MGIYYRYSRWNGSCFFRDIEKLSHLPMPWGLSVGERACYGAFADMATME